MHNYTNIIDEDSYIDAKLEERKKKQVQSHKEVVDFGL